MSILKNRVLPILLLSAAPGFHGAIFFAQAGTAAALETVAVAANHPADLANVLPDAMPLAPGRTLEMEVTFALRNRRGLERLLNDLQTPTSPRYRHWLTRGEFDRRFGPTRAQVEAVRQWLVDQSFTIRSVNPRARYIAFSGTVAQAQTAFGVSIVAGRDGRLFANTTDPFVPARFAGTVSAIRGLDNLIDFQPAYSPHASPAALASMQPVDSLGDAVPAYNYQGFGPDAFGPQDVWTFYDELPLHNAHIDGAGTDCIAIIGVSDYSATPLDLFNSTFSLPGISLANSFPQGNPGIDYFGAEVEILLDIEYAHATAPAAPIHAYIGKGDLLEAIRQSVADNTCGVINISFGYCTLEPSFYTAQLDPLFAQAATQGQSVFLASGDSGAAGIVFDPGVGHCVNGTSRNVSEMAADPNVTAVGGTQFAPNYDANGNNVGTVPEASWDESGFGATGGGVSTIFPKPAYQAGPGVPDDGFRDVPDIAMAAGVNLPGFYLAIDDFGSPELTCCIGGTSISAPIWAGIDELIAQEIGGRLGNLNPALYELGRAPNPASKGLRDVTGGDNSFVGVAGFPATPGYDLTTGWGTPDMTLLVSAVSGQPPPPVNATLTVTPKAINHGNQVVLGTFGTTGKARYVTLFNPKTKTQNQTIIIEAINVTGDFATADDACIGPLAPNAKCQVPVAFTPTGSGLRTGTLTVSANTSVTPNQVSMRGNGVLGKLTYAPKRLGFGRVHVGESSPAKTVTLTNRNEVPMTLGAITVSANFVITNNLCGGTLGPNGVCSVSVVFAPTATGAAHGTLTIPDNALGAPHTVNLNGTGLPTAVAP